MVRRKRNIFVVALDDFQRYFLESTHPAEECAFYPLLDASDVLHQNTYDFDALLDRARRQLDDFGGPVDAILAHWDFPTTPLVAILCQERGLRSPSLQAVAACTHKYWNRLLQREAVPEITPAFARLDPFDERAADDLDVPYPMWLKPITGYSSQLGYKVADRDELRARLAEIREAVHRLGDPFEAVLARVDTPPELAGSGTECMVEEYLSGFEVAHEGHVFAGEVHIHGVIDMVREKETFLGYEYPSEMPAEVQERINEAGARLIRHIGFDDGCFNAEYFWDPESDRITIIEVNPRLSQSHSYLFHTVDGASSHEILVDIALGRRPHFARRRGRHAKAAKMFLRSFNDGIVRAAPTWADILETQREVTDSYIDVVVEPGQRLAELFDQDAYSYELAELYVPGEGNADLMRNYERLVEALRFDIEPVDEHPEEQEEDEEGERAHPTERRPSPS